MKKCFTFYFSIYDYDNIDDISTDNDQFCFIELESDISSKQEEALLSQCNKLNLESNYGIHDISFGEKFIIDNVSHESIFGFNSYEVSIDKIDELMNIWKNILSDVGLSASNIVKMNDKQYVSSIV